MSAIRMYFTRPNPRKMDATQMMVVKLRQRSLIETAQRKHEADGWALKLTKYPPLRGRKRVGR